MKTRTVIACAAAMLTVGCGGPEQTANKYVSALNAKRFREAEELLATRVVTYIGPGALARVHSGAVIQRIQKVTVTGNRAVVDLQPLNADGGAPAQPNVVTQGAFVLNKTDSGWSVIDCPSVVLTVLDASDAKDHEKALAGVALVKEAACLEAVTTKLEASVLAAKGSDAYEQGSYERATEALQRAIQLNRTARTHYVLGYVYRDNKAITNNLERAIEQFSAAVELEPDTAAYHDALADVYRQNKNIDGAIREFKKALELDPTQKQTHFFYALALIQKNSYGEAAEQLERVIVIDPNYRNTRELLSYVRRQQAVRAAYRYWQ